MYNKNCDCLLQCNNIFKSFNGVKALEDVSFSIHRGRVHGLIGENGAGKSTLIKIISGLYNYDSGVITLEGKKINICNPEEMLSNGVATIYQDINLVETMSVSENIYLNNEIKYGLTGILKESEIRKKTSELLNEYSIKVDPSNLVKNLPNDIKKMIQIIKAIARNARILLMDEPTSSLTKLEEKKILDLIRTLASRGTGVVFISHYLNEIFEVCDDITVLRDGKLVSTVNIKETNLNEVIKMMIGKTISDSFLEKQNYIENKEVLRIDNLNVKGKLKDISLSLHKGEILGITGLIGSGCSELGRAIIASEDIKIEDIKLEISGKSVKIKSPEDAVKNRIAYITDDRVHEGLLQRLSIYENICLSTLAKYKNKAHLLNEKKMIASADDYIKLLSIKTPSAMAAAQILSGGNQQKVLLAKGLNIKPLIFIMNEPTIGIDVGTKFEIRKLILKLAQEGVSIILITSELEELEKLCDRVLILFRGEIIKQLEKCHISRNNIIEASTGGNQIDD